MEANLPEVPKDVPAAPEPAAPAPAPAFATAVPPAQEERRLYGPKQPAAFDHRDDQERDHAAGQEADMKRNPIDARTVFYLAQTYRELGRTEDALRLYRQRMTMGGFEEERWYASYRAALLETEWSARSAALMASWEARPWRLEPLYELAKECNARGWHHLGYLLTEVPTDPTLDQLFVHSSVWDWGIMFERSIAAWWVAGSRDEFESLSATLLANPRLPQAIREAVEHNLGLEARVA